MENVVAYLKDHWQYVVIAGGGLTLLGAIFNWRWVTSPDGERPNGPGRFIYDIRTGRVSCLYGRSGRCNYCLWDFLSFCGKIKQKNKSKYGGNANGNDCKLSTNH